MTGTTLRSSKTQITLATFTTGNPFRAGVGVSIDDGTPGGRGIFGNASRAWILANAGSVGPLPEPDPPILPRSACVPRCQDDMQMGQPVAQDKAVDVFGPGHILQRSGQTVHQETQSDCLAIREIA